MEGHRFIPKQGARLGRVVCVSGAQVVVLLEPGPVDSAASSVHMGELVKLHNGGSTIFGVVRGLSVPMPGVEAHAGEIRVVELDLLGEAVEHGDDDASTRRFKRAG